MKLDAAKVRQARESKSWSQEHLAAAAGVGLRTVQRIESGGSASAETRLAIAGALGLAVQELAEIQPQTASPERSAATAFSGGALVFAAAAAASLFVLAQGSRLPPTVVSHFGISGTADGHMTREAFIALMCATVSTVPSFVWWLLGHAVRHGHINVPNADHWLSAEQRQGTETYVLRQAALLSVLFAAFLCFVFWLVVSANLASPAAASAGISMSLLLLGLGTFLAAVVVWLVALESSFRSGSVRGSRRPH